MFTIVNVSPVTVGGATWLMTGWSSHGEGTLLKAGKAAAYYKTTGASFGLQAGGQQYGYAMFFMNEKALSRLMSLATGEASLRLAQGVLPDVRDPIL